MDLLRSAAPASSFVRFLPKDEALTALDTWAKVLVQSKLEPEDWKRIATALGEEDISDFPTIAALDDQDYLQAVKEVGINPIAKARLNLAVNIARLQFGADAHDIFESKAAGLPASASSSGAPVAIMNETQTTVTTVQNVAVKDLLRVASYFDQGSRLEVKPLESEAIEVRRARWLNKMGVEPGEDLYHSDQQVSIYARLQAHGHNMLAFDMGVWGPFSERRDRHFQLETWHKNAHDEWVCKEIPGAMCLEDWQEAWAFATTGFVMHDEVDHGVADAYKNFFAAMANTYPRAWFICCIAEWRLRFEWAPKELRRQKAFHTDTPTLSKFDPDRPWNSVLSAAIMGLESITYWERHLKEKARKWLTEPIADSNPSWVTRQEEILTGDVRPQRTPLPMPKAWLPGPPVSSWARQAGPQKNTSGLSISGGRRCTSSKGSQNNIRTMAR